MITKNLGYIISIITIILCLIIIYQKYSYTQKLLNDTSSASTVRKEDPSPTLEKDEKPQQQNKIHTIVAGDTLWDLSVKYYGDGTKYPEIIKKNPGKTFKFSNGQEGLIYPGTELEI
jgi:nucleoid-associated protein YgaU